MPKSIGNRELSKGIAENAVPGRDGNCRSRSFHISSAVEKTTLKHLESFGNRISKFGVNFAVLSSDGGLVLEYDGGRFKSSERLRADAQRLIVQGRSEYKGQGPNEPFLINDRFLAAVLK
jgi:hypothetical protein